MLSQSALALALTLALGLLVPSTLAGFVIIESTSFVSNINLAQASSIEKIYESAISSYAAEITTGAAYNSAWDAVRSYEALSKGDVPAVVTATDRVVTYTSTPAWYTALPSDARQFFESAAKKQDELAASAVRAVKGDAARPTGRGVLVGGTMAALVAGVAAVL